jgi:hypothetical protein
MQNNLFKKSSMERISSPEKLNDFIKVANPAGWMVLAASLSVVLGLLIWGIFGRLNETVQFNGCLKDGQLICYTEGSLAGKLEQGMKATIFPQGSGETFDGCILTVAEHPLSFDEASRFITSDYMLASLGITGWNIPVAVETDAPLYEGVVYTVTVVTDTYRPIEMVFR